MLHHETIAPVATGLGLSVWAWGALGVNAAIYHARQLWQCIRRKPWS